jgi:hypothetical protein
MRLKPDEDTTPTRPAFLPQATGSHSPRRAVFAPGNRRGASDPARASEVRAASVAFIILFGFAGHNAPAQFRNISIKPLE